MVMYNAGAPPAKLKINRLVLIGNGFNLAHGMKTSYNDFIHWHITSMMLWGGTGDSLAITAERNQAVSFPPNYYRRNYF